MSNDRREQGPASVFIATSLDGYIARRNGDIDWLPSPEGGGGEDYGYSAFMETVDALVIGRATFEKALSFGGWPYGKRRVVVLTSRPLPPPPNATAKIEAMSGDPHEIVDALAARGIRHLYVDGGVTIQRFLEAGLIHRLIITRIPVLLGDGLPLFGPLSRDVNLEHVDTRHWPNGLVQSEYRVLR
jgi:dihydrofolate reductase